MTRQWTCDVCNKAPDCPMLKNEVWDQIALRDAVLCFQRTEIALKRQININDLKPCPANAPFIVMIERVKHSKG